MNSKKKDEDFYGINFSEFVRSLLETYIDLDFGTVRKEIGTLFSGSRHWTVIDSFSARDFDDRHFYGEIRIADDFVLDISLIDFIPNSPQSLFEGNNAKQPGITFLCIYIIRSGAIRLGETSEPKSPIRRSLPDDTVFNKVINIPSHYIIGTRFHKIKKVYLKSSDLIDSKGKDWNFPRKSVDAECGLSFTQTNLNKSSGIAAECLSASVYNAERTGDRPGGRPLLAILMVVRNGAKFIEQAIQSVIGQLTSDFEFIIWDGESTDQTVEIIRRYEYFIKKWESAADSGIYNALNRAVRMVSADYYCVIGCDDILSPCALEVYRREIIAGSPPVCFSVMDDLGRKLVPLGNSLRFSHRAFFSQHSVGTIIPLDLHNKYGFYPEDFRAAGDSYFLRKIARSEEIKFVDITVGIYRLNGTSTRTFKNFIEYSRVQFSMEPLFVFLFIPKLFIEIVRVLYATLRR